MPSGGNISGNAFERQRTRRSLAALREVAGGATGSGNSPKNDNHVRRTIMGLNKQFTNAPGQPLRANPKNAIEFRRAIAALRRAT